MANVLLTAHGTFGDLIPVARIGSILKAAGHDVTFITHCYYEAMLRQVGLNFVALDTPQEFEQYTEDLSLLRTLEGQIAFSRRHTLPKALLEYELLSQRCAAPDTVLIGSHFFGLGPQITAEKLGLPLVRVFTALAYMTGLPFLERLCRQYFGDDINHLRARVGLPPVTDWHAWLRCARQNIGSWPEWFAEPDGSWLPNLAEVGFLTFDPAEVGEIPAKARDFLNDGEPPVLITGGTGTYLSSKFYTVCLEACRLLDCRALLVTRHRQHVPEDLPAKVKWFAYLPFGSVMPHVAAIVHHGGMSTASRALTVGVPQLALAEGIDRPDTAARFERLGVAKHLPPAQWQPEQVAEALRWLIGSAQVRQRCRALARRASESDPAAAVCAVIEGLAGQENDAVQAPPSDSTADDLSARLSKLSPEKRALLALALEKNQDRRTI